MVPKEAIKARQGLNESIRRDLDSSVIELRELAIQDITLQSSRAFGLLAKQTYEAAKTLERQDLLSAENSLTLNAQYSQERERVRQEVLVRAKAWTNILRKIQGSSKGVLELENMEQFKADTYARLITDVLKATQSPAFQQLISSSDIDPKLWELTKALIQPNADELTLGVGK